MLHWDGTFSWLLSRGPCIYVVSQAIANMCFYPLGLQHLSQNFQHNFFFFFTIDWRIYLDASYLKFQMGKPHYFIQTLVAYTLRSEAECAIFWPVYVRIGLIMSLQILWWRQSDTSRYKRGQLSPNYLHIRSAILFQDITLVVPGKKALIMGNN